MRTPVLALAFVLAASNISASAQSASVAGPLTLAAAMRQAESAHPSVRAREAQLAAAEGSSREAASLLFGNPQLSAERTRRRPEALDGRADEWAVGVAQPIEIGGQQARRREATAASLQALRAEIDEARRQARADAALRFYAVLAAQRRVQLEQRSLELFDAAAQTVAKRRTAGEDTRLDANVALVESERARNAVGIAREHLLDARTELGTVLQMSPTTLPNVIDDDAPPTVAAMAYGLDNLLASAQHMPKLRALTLREEAARARVGVEHASRYPDITVGVSTGREGPGDARERVTTLSLSVPLPLFKRNEAAIGQALSEATQAEIERAAATRDAQAQVRRLWSRFESQRDRVQRLQQALLAASADNQQLAAKSRQAGQIGLLDQLLVNRQALDAERDFNDALTELQTTRIELEHTAGWSQQGTAK